MTTEARYHRIVLIEIEGFSMQPETAQAGLRRNLYDMTESALSSAGVGPDQYTVEDRGHGVLILVSAGTALTILVRDFMQGLEDALASYQWNAHRLRLLVGLGQGLVAWDPHGWAGAAINDLAQLVDGAPVKQVLAQAEQARLVLVVSENVYASVVRHGYRGIDPAAYGPTEFVTRHGERLRAWITVPGYPAPPGLPPAPETEENLRSAAHGGQVHAGSDIVFGDYVSGSKIVRGPGEAIAPAGHTPPGPAQDPDDDWPRETPES
ncbi:hypothetical protein [Streptomyces sp. NPDC001076]